MSAEQDYLKVHQELLDVYHKLGKLIEQHKKDAQEDGIAYDWVGDLHKAKSDLADVCRFLGET